MSSVFLMACVLSQKLGGVGLLLAQGAPPEGPGQALCKASPRPEPGLRLTVLCALDQGGKQGYGNG